MASGDPGFDESFEFELSAGWNLVSFPCLPADPSFSSLLSDLSFYLVYTWDGSSYISPGEAEPGLGYWLWVPEETTLTVVDGEPVESFELDLPPGWSMIGSIFPCTVDAGLVFPGFYQLYTWDGSSYDPSTIIEPGRGYWAFVPAETHIVVDESCAVHTNNPPQADYLQILHEPPETVGDGGSHECRFWGMISEILPESVVLDHLVTLPYSLKNLGGGVGGNNDGWGLAYYDDTEPVVSRGKPPAYTDANFNLAAGQVATSGKRIAVGHVRAASSGASDIPNPHPFIRQRGGRHWAFGHNGGLSKSLLYTLIGNDYLYQFDPPDYAPTGWYDPRVVDSDLYMIYLLKCVEVSGWDVRAGIAKAVVDISSVASGAMNFFLTDGETLWGFRKGNSLYYLYDAGDIPPYSALASQPPEGSGAPGWISMSDWNLVELTVDATPSLIPDVRALYPPVYDSLTASYTYFDEDGDPESGSEIRWYKDGILQSDFNDILTVPSDDTANGEEWYFTVRPSDGEDFGDLKTSPTVTIGEHVKVRFEDVWLTPVDPDITSPSGDYRWMDVADQAYSSDYRDSYHYSQAAVKVTHSRFGNTFSGVLIAQNLKPNFAYQLKLVCTPGTVDNERIGLVGRWWQEIWDGSAWSDGWNLNDKGDGSSPNPNDITYFARRHIEDSSSPTGYHYLYTAYLVFDYFITDSNGDAMLNFETGNCYHVLWKTSQRGHTADDGPVKTVIFDPDPSEEAYDTDYPSTTTNIFGEWERPPMGEVQVSPGDYSCQILLTEESFHSWLGDPLEGNWAGAMSADITFTITD